MTTSISFAPAASVSFMAQTFSPGTYNLPAFDASNLDLMIQNNGIAGAVVFFAGGGCRLSPGQSILLTANATVLAAAVGHASVGNMASAGSNATTCQAQADQVGGTISITRGTATAAVAF
jgi:hypothetical protein